MPLFSKVFKFGNVKKGYKLIISLSWETVFLAVCSLTIRVESFLEFAIRKESLATFIMRSAPDVQLSKHPAFQTFLDRVKSYFFFAFRETCFFLWQS